MAEYKRSVGQDLRRLGKSGTDPLLTKLAEERFSRALPCRELAGGCTGLRKIRVREFRVIFAILSSPFHTMGQHGSCLCRRSPPASGRAAGIHSPIARGHLQARSWLSCGLHSGTDLQAHPAFQETGATGQHPFARHRLATWTSPRFEMATRRTSCGTYLPFSNEAQRYCRPVERLVRRLLLLDLHRIGSVQACCLEP